MIASSQHTIRHAGYHPVDKSKHWYACVNCAVGGWLIGADGFEKLDGFDQPCPSKPPPVAPPKAVQLHEWRNGKCILCGYTLKQGDVTATLVEPCPGRKASKFELPELPPPDTGLGMHRWAYSSQQMREYARDAVNQLLIDIRKYAE